MSTACRIFEWLARNQTIFWLSFCNQSAVRTIRDVSSNDVKVVEVLFDSPILDVGINDSHFVTVIE